MEPSAVRSPAIGDLILVTAERLAASRHTGEIISGPTAGMVYHVRLDAPRPMFNGLPLDYIWLEAGEFAVVLPVEKAIRR